LAIGSSLRRFSKLSFFRAAAHGWYGISLPSTTPWPAGTPRRAGWSWMSHAAVLRACQTPCRSGLPSGVRGGVYAEGPSARTCAAIGADAIELTTTTTSNHVNLCRTPW